MTRRPALLALASVLAGCADMMGPRTLRIQESDLADRIALRFPIERSLLDLVDLTLSDPRVRLRPEDGRIAAEVAVHAVERRGVRHAEGTMAVDFGLRVEPTDGTLRLVQPRVQRLDVSAGATTPLRRAVTEQLLRDAATVAGRVLDGYVVYALPAQRLQSMRSAGYQLGELRVVPGALELTLVPQAASAPSR